MKSVRKTGDSLLANLNHQWLKITGLKLNHSLVSRQLRMLLIQVFSHTTLCWENNYIYKNDFIKILSPLFRNNQESKETFFKDDNPVTAI